MLGCLHTLFLIGCYEMQDVSTLGNLHDLYLEGCDKIKDIRMLDNVHTLYQSNVIVCYL